MVVTQNALAKNLKPIFLFVFPGVAVEVFDASDHLPMQQSDIESPPEISNNAGLTCYFLWIWLNLLEKNTFLIRKIFLFLPKL